MNDEEAQLNDKWDSYDRDDWLDTKYTDHSNCFKLVTRI